jgi:hypothetical protein
MSPLVHRNIQPQARSLREMVRMVADGSLDLNAPYQRGDVWAGEQRVNLIRSLLLGVPVAAIVLNRRGGNADWRRNEGDPGEVWYACIDGKQRLTTAVHWWNSKLAVPAEWIDSVFVAESRDGLVVNSMLTEVGQRLVGSRFLIPIAEAQLGTLAEEAEVYGLINSAGTAQSAADMDRAAAVAGSGLSGGTPR